MSIKEFNFKWHNGVFEEELSEFIDKYIVLRDDLIGLVMYDFVDGKLLLEQIDEMDIVESLSEFKNTNAKLVVSDADVRMHIHNNTGSFNAIIKDIPASFEMEYSEALDSGNDRDVFDLVKRLPKLSPKNADYELMLNGFELTQNSEKTLRFNNVEFINEEIYFNKSKKTYTAKRKGSKPSPLVINAQLHKAINMKIEELGWY